MNNRKRACVIIIDNDKVLLMYRIKDSVEYYTTIWWWIEEWETPEQTAIREVKEETNLDVKLDWIFCELEDKIGYWIYYIAKSFSWEEKLGWPEAERNNKDNWYELRRVRRKDLKNIFLVPKEIKENLMSWISDMK